MFPVQTVKMKECEPMIQCPKCKAENQSDAARCKNCNADLLPNWSIWKRLLVIVPVMVMAVLCFWMGLTNSQDYSTVSASGKFLVYFPYFLSAGLAIAAVIYGFKNAPPHWRYLARARKYKGTDPKQAFQDYTKAVSLSKGRADIRIWRERNQLFDKFEFDIDKTSQEIDFLTQKMKSMPKRGFNQIRANVFQEIAIEILKLYEKQSTYFLSISKMKDAVRTQLQFLAFAEEHINEIRYFQMDQAQWGAGVTLQLRGQLRDQIFQMRQAMWKQKLIHVTGYCPKCKETVEPDDGFRCPQDKSHKLRDLKYFVPEEISESNKTIESLLS
jgi:hypothetical protein